MRSFQQGFLSNLPIFSFQIFTILFPSSVLLSDLLLLLFLPPSYSLFALYYLYHTFYSSFQLPDRLSSYLISIIVCGLSYSILLSLSSLYLCIPFISLCYLTCLPSPYHSNYCSSTLRLNQHFLLSLFVFIFLYPIYFF